MNRKTETITELLKAKTNPSPIERARWAAQEIALRFIPADSVGDQLYLELRRCFDEIQAELDNES